MLLSTTPSGSYCYIVVAMPDYENMHEDQPDASLQKTVRTLGASIGLGLLVAFAACITFLGTCAVGAIVGTRVSAAGGPMNEHHMGHGVVTGVIAGLICSLVVAIVLSRLIFRKQNT